MSMQTQNGVSGPLTHGLEIRPVNGESRPRHLRRTAARKARRLRERQEIAEAVRLGMQVVPKVRFDRLWQEWEDTVVRNHADDLETIYRKLPHRSRKACEHRRKDLDLGTRAAEWKRTEDQILRENYLKMSSAAGLLSLVPGRSLSAVVDRLGRLKLTIPRPASDTGSPVVDAIKDRCRALGYTVGNLDEMTGTGRYFRRRCYLTGGERGKGAHPTTQFSSAISKAVKALGGELRVEWPD